MLRTLIALAAGWVSTAALAQQLEWVPIELPEGPPLRVAVLEPESPAPDAPVLLAFAPGSQNERMVMLALDLYWRNAVEQRGWVVVSPAAPGRLPFHEGSERFVPEIVALIDARFEPDGIHVAGVSSGGKSAFRVAESLGERCASLSALPGYPATARDAEALDQLADVPVTLIVGALDRTWRRAMEETAGALEALGRDVVLHVVDGQSHRLEGDVAELVFERINAVRKGSEPDAPTRQSASRGEPERLAPDEHVRAISRVLDDWHDAASDADFERYFSHFAEDGVFLGTDDSERWTREEFESFARPYFSKGTGWTYVPVERQVEVSEDGRVAWFDERLDNRKLGRCRGTGVLVLEGGRWLLAHYSLTIPIPNGVALDVVETIRQADDETPGGEP